MQQIPNIPPLLDSENEVLGYQFPAEPEEYGLVALVRARESVADEPAGYYRVILYEPYPADEPEVGDWLGFDEAMHVFTRLVREGEIENK